MIYIVGLGPGNRDYMLPKAIERLENSDSILGFSRALKSLEFIKTNKICAKSLKDILNYINENPNKKISIVASGDPCFYGITDYLKKNYDKDVVIIPGISSFQYLAAKLNKSWNGSYLGSLHGRKENFIEKVKNYKLTIWLTDKNNSPNFICEKLIEQNIETKVYVGENLSYQNERIIEGIPKDIIDITFSDLSVVIVENLNF